MNLATLAKILKGKSFSKGKSNLQYSETEGRRKFKFDEVSFQIGQFFLKENRAKKFPS